MMNFYDFIVKNAEGASVKMADFKGKPVLIVNVASKCGFTPQYEGLEALYQKYASRGLSILGFPCNQFGGQEPGSDDEIQNFCRLNYQVSFPVLSKIDVNGETADPLFQFLKDEAPGLLGSKAIKWNFTKFLVDKEGKVVKRFAPTTKPQELQTDIEAVL